MGEGRAPTAYFVPPWPTRFPEAFAAIRALLRRGTEGAHGRSGARLRSSMAGPRTCLRFAPPRGGATAAPSSSSLTLRFLVEGAALGGAGRVWVRRFLAAWGGVACVDANSTRVSATALRFLPTVGRLTVGGAAMAGRLRGRRREAQPPFATEGSAARSTTVGNVAGGRDPSPTSSVSILVRAP